LYDLLDGVGGNDVMSGDAGNDIMYGQSGNDTMSGGAGDDEMYGGLGNDVMSGDAGDDVMLGGLGQIVRAFNANGTPKLNPDGSWHKDVLLTDVAYVVGSISLEGPNVPCTGDMATVNALANSDISLLTRVYNTDGSIHSNSDRSDDDRLILLNLIRDGNDVMHGGDGNDAMFGQLGNDTIMGDAGNDFISGGTGNDSLDGGDGSDTVVGDDAFIDSTNPAVPNVTHGYLVIHTATSTDAAAGLNLGMLGTTIVPMVPVEPGREISAASMALPDVLGYTDTLPADDSLHTTTGMRVVPYASVIVDYGHHLDLLHGDDTISAGTGTGNDTLVGDDMIVLSPTVTFDAAGAAKAQTIARAELDLSNDFADLIHNQYRLLPSYDHYGWGDYDDPLVIDHVFSIGEDSITGGTGNDVIIGDDSIEVAPTFTVAVSQADNFERWQEAMPDAGDQIAEAVVDFVRLEDGLRDKFIQVQHGRYYETDIEHHVDLIMMGNDTIYGGTGNDLIVGDAFVMRAPSVTLTAGGSANHYNYDPTDDWLNGENWNYHGERASWWRAWDFDDYYHTRQDVIETDADVIYGGTGNDLIWGDSVALLTSTINRGAGISSRDYADASNDVGDALGALSALTNETDYWLDFRDRDHDHSHDNFTYTNQADKDFEHAHHHNLDDADFISGGDGNDILFGQDGTDTIQGNAGDDWLIGGGSSYDYLDGGTGRNHVYQGDNNSEQLEDLVEAAMPTWSGAFSTLGLPVVPFSANTATTQGHPNLADFDYLRFELSPWDGRSPVWQTAVGGTPSDGAAAITQAQLDPIVAEAKLLWTQALGAGDSRLAALDSVSVSVGNLPQDHIGATVGTQITIDGTAAGRGWFVDSTPQDDSEFGIYVGTGELHATPGSAAYGRMDLLTTVMHELGNAMGFPEDLGHDVMSETLQTGVRDLPGGEFGPAAVAQGTAPASPGAVFAVLDPSLIAPASPAASIFGAQTGGTIDWSGTLLGAAGGGGDSGSHWLGDFVNHLGKSEAQRNPNSVIKVQVGAQTEVLPALSRL